MHSHPAVPDFADTGGSIQAQQAREKRQEEDASEDDDNEAPPPTPTVQHFYAGAKKKEKNHRDAGVTVGAVPLTIPSASNSSSLIPSMAEALVSGGPMVEEKLRQQQQQQPQQKASLPSSDSFSMDNPSPLSPAVLMGTPQENLLLPPPGETTSMQFRQASSATTSHPQHPLQHPAQHQQHMAWLSDINARAQMAAGQQSQQQQPAPAMHPMAMMGYYPHSMAAHANPYLYAAAMAQKPHETKDPVESEEKRIKRLERNRESARKSRRKKKERLTTLEAQVNKLHQEIDTERRNRIDSMVHRMKEIRSSEVKKFTNELDSSQIVPLIQYTGPYNSVSRSVLDFQYTRLRQVTLPGYQKFILWSVMRDDAFFTVAKDQSARPDAGTNNQQSRGSSSKLSSKQIGEALFAAGTRVDSQDADAKDRAAGQFASSYAYDNTRTWPLFCSEHKLSVDQEDKFLLLRKKTRKIPDIGNVQSQMNAAVRTVESLRVAVHSVSRAVAIRDESAYISILSPSQTAAYQNWLSTNREACRRVVSSQRQREDTLQDGPATKDTSLHDICRRLNEVLRISGQTA